MRFHRPSPIRPPGFSTIETVIATLVVSMVLVAALRVAAASNLAQYKTAERATGRFLADGLMADLLQLPYEDPNGSPIFGIDLGEVLGIRSGYDDLDDFNGWSESPPQDRGGTAIPNLSGWQRSVVVERVSRTTLATVLVETGAKRVTVTVKHNNAVVATRFAICTNTP